MSELVNPAKDEFLANYVGKPFEITQEDIDTAVRKNSFECILAKVLKRFLGPKFENIIVHTYNVTIGFDNTWQWFFIQYSHDVQEYIHKFDDGQPITPMTLSFRFTGRSKHFPDLCFWYPKGHTKESIEELADYYETKDGVKT